MTNSISIGHTTELPLVFYKNQPVVTLAMIDRVHGRTDGTARRTFTANKERLIPDEDYFKLSESEMKAMDEFRPSANPKGILLISESGYLMLVKSFNDDLAWKIQRQLIKAYFRAKPPAIQTITKQQFLDLRRIVFSISDKLPGRQSVEWHIWKRVRDMFGVKSAMDLPASEFQAAENMLLQLQATTEEFDNQVSAIKKRFCKEVLLVDGDMGELVQLLEQID